MSPLGSVAVVMPAYNEADGIAEFITEIDAAFKDAGISISVGVVEDCSTDGTSAEVERLVS